MGYNQSITVSLFLLTLFSPALVWVLHRPQLLSGELAWTLHRLWGNLFSPPSLTMVVTGLFLTLLATLLTACPAFFALFLIYYFTEAPRAGLLGSVVLCGGATLAWPLWDLPEVAVPSQRLPLWHLLPAPRHLHPICMAIFFCRHYVAMTHKYKA